MVCVGGGGAHAQEDSWKLEHSVRVAASDEYTMFVGGWQHYEFISCAGKRGNCLVMIYHRLQVGMLFGVSGLLLLYK